MSDLERFKHAHERRLERIDERLLELSAMKLSIIATKDNRDGSFDAELENIEKLATSLEKEKEDIRLELKDIETEMQKLEKEKQEAEKERADQQKEKEDA
ncbi:hypothetical protein F5Y06DRAFT_301352 [Hypoxylon sp. FL0890]|nr:hypothetical protein F5Y06DRAFT_301352 [Hypoxylon sp. FL0890]